MSKNDFSVMDGKALTVNTFSVERCNGGLAVKMECVTEDQKTYCAVFENVSVLTMCDVSYPFQIGGFEVTDHHQRGYQNDARFFINDYEDGRLSFFCEEFEIFDRP